VYMNTEKNGRVPIALRMLNRNKTLYLMALPAVVLMFLFSYFPLFGLLIAFKDFQFDKGILFSDWMKPIYSNFVFLFDNSAALRAIKNTLLLNCLFIVTGVVFEVGLALMLNEIKNKTFKKVTQSVTFLPFFMSWMIVGVFAYNLLSTDTGVINNILSSLGLDKINWYTNAGVWPFILAIVTRWKFTGYGSVIYLATLAGVDPVYYEAAKMDGATKWQQMIHISLPSLKPAIIMLTLLQIGRIMNADFGMFYALVGDASLLYSTTDVIDTFIYRSLKLTGDIGMGSATGLVQSVLSFALVIGCNAIIKKYEKDSALF